MSIFTIADLHLSLNSKKPMDIFRGWENYLEKLERNWRAVVKDTDTVVLPGDLSWAMSIEDMLEDLLFLESLPGRKILLKGNHDYWWTTMRKMQAFLDEHHLNDIQILHNNAYASENISICGTRGWFYDETSAEDKKVLMREAGRLEASVREAEKTGLEPVAFLHYPPVASGFVCRELLEVLKRHGVKRCYYGHLHGRAASSAVEGVYEGIRFRLVSADKLKFTPLIIE